MIGLDFRSCDQIRTSLSQRSLIIQDIHNSPMSSKATGRKDEIKMRSTEFHVLHGIVFRTYLGNSAGDLRAHLQWVSQVRQKLTLRITAGFSKKTEANLHHKHGITDIRKGTENICHGTAHRTLQHFLQHECRGCQTQGEQQMEGTKALTRWHHKHPTKETSVNFLSWYYSDPDNSTGTSPDGSFLWLQLEPQRNPAGGGSGTLRCPEFDRGDVARQNSCHFMISACRCVTRFTIQMSGFPARNRRANWVSMPQKS